MSLGPRKVRSVHPQGALRVRRHQAPRELDNNEHSVHQNARSPAECSTGEFGHAELGASGAGLTLWEGPSSQAPLDGSS